MRLEGKAMHHCIGFYATRGFGDPGSTYGRLVFFRVQWGEERASLAVLYCTELRARGTYSVTEINSFQNQGVSNNLKKEVEYLVDTWNKGA